jgi:hypothetical protein
MIAWNDRRKAKKAASATMKTTLGQMAKSGSLRATTTTPGGREFGKRERAAVQEQAQERATTNYLGGTRENTKPQRQDYDASARNVDKAKDVKGYDAPAYRKMDADNNKRGQQKKYLPKKAGK